MVMGKAIAIAAGGGAASALMMVSLPIFGLLGAFLLSSLAPLPLLLVGLSLGLPGVAVATASGAVLLAVSGGGIVAAATLILTYGLPAMLLSRQALLNRTEPDGRTEWYPPGLLLLWAAGYGLLGIVVAVLLTIGEQGGLPGMIARQLTALTDEMPPEVAAAIRQVGIEQIAVSLPGASVMVWLLQVFVNLWLAQSILVRARRAVRPSLDIADIELPSWAVLSLAVACLLALISTGLLGFLALNTALAFGICFFIAGLAVIHAAVRGKPFKPLALTAVYLSLLLSWPALLIAGLGVVEPWAGFRRRALARTREN